MRVSEAIIAVAALASAIPLEAAARPAQTSRHVELISMLTKPAEEVADPAAGLPPAMEASALLPAEFHVHDLSRRYVEYRMAQELAGTAAHEALTDAVATAPTASPMIAATSSIVVPGWMRGAYPGAPTLTYSPGCSPLAYRPAGFLSRAAETRRAAYYGMMSAIACEHGLPTGLFDAMIMRESGYNPSALSSANAYGLAQLMPGTAVDLGVNRYDPAQNMRGGARYLRQQLDRFGQVHLALAAYNAGPGRVRNGMIPQIAETQAYVSNIIANWSRISGASSPAPARTQIARARVRQVGLTSF